MAKAWSGFIQVWKYGYVELMREWCNTSQELCNDCWSKLMYLFNLFFKSFTISWRRKYFWKYWSWLLLLYFCQNLQHQFLLNPGSGKKSMQNWIKRIRITLLIQIRLIFLLLSQGWTERYNNWLKAGEWRWSGIECKNRIRKIQRHQRF